jgi:ribose transport system substrate-binding protein
MGPSNQTNISERQVEILTELMPPNVDGFAELVKNETAIVTLIEQAISMNKFAITFDSDASESKRHAHVGTDNYKFGHELAHVLMQLHPNGGTYVILTGALSMSPNFKARMDGVLDGLF